MPSTADIQIRARRALAAVATLSVLAGTSASRAADPGGEDSARAAAIQPVPGTPSPPNREAGLDEPKWMRDAIANHVAVCWRMPHGEPGQGLIEVRARFDLDTLGNLVEPPIVDASAKGSADDAYLAAARESALTAIVNCAPYEFLPPERYADWRKVDITFQFRAPGSDAPADASPSP
jgi:hypothetical protein